MGAYELLTGWLQLIRPVISSKYSKVMMTQISPEWILSKTSIKAISQNWHKIQLYWSTDA